MIDNLSIAVHPFSMCTLTSLPVDEILLLRYVNWFANFRGLQLRVEMATSCLKHMNFVLSTLMSSPMLPAFCSRQQEFGLNSCICKS